MMNDFTAAKIKTAEVTIFVRYAGSGLPVLLLHGFPETHLMWAKVAKILAQQFTVVCADLRGYGRSSCPVSTPTHEAYSKRVMGNDLIDVMQQLGFERFSIAGHDRGGRVAYRMALDHPERVERLAVLDVVPTETVWKSADSRFALSFWPWSVLTQPEPLPERILTVAAEAIVDDALNNWGSPASSFSREARAEFVSCLEDPQHAHAICEEYRAAATIDREHDRADRESGRRITCPVLVLWSSQGGLATWYVDQGGPLGIWKEWANDVRGRALDAGHFFPEEVPEQTAGALQSFLL
jgi:haloacetate dehalogenase